MDPAIADWPDCDRGPDRAHPNPESPSVALAARRSADDDITADLHSTMHLLSQAVLATAIGLGSLAIMASGFFAIQEIQHQDDPGYYI